jgi:hypothetical protein
MLKICGAALLAIVVSVGAAEARAVAHPHKHFMACGDGLVKATCMCSPAKGHGQLCKAGQWCHTFEGACRS